MNPSRAFLLVYLPIAGLVLAQVTEPQTRQVSGVVQTLDGKPLPHVTIRMTNISGTTTTDSGEFTFNLSPKIVPGQPIELSLEGDWVISSPWEGRTFVPMLGTDVIHVRVAHKGDPRLLADPELVQNIVVGVTSQLKPFFAGELGNLTVAAQPDDYLAPKAKELGLTESQMKSAIDVWVTEVKGPYQKGLAALYGKRFGDASQLFKHSIAASEGDLFAEYYGLADAELSQGHFVDAESALRKALAIQPEHTGVLDKLGWILARQDRFSEAQSALELAINIDERVTGRDSPNVAIHLTTIGCLYGMSGHFPEAESALERAQAILGRSHETGDRALAVYLNLAEILRAQGKYAEAKINAERALSITNRQGGPLGLVAEYPLIQLGLIYANTGLYVQAVELLKRAQTTDERELGPSHPDVVRDLINLASVYIREDDYVSAGPLLERALSISQEGGRADSLEAAGALCNLGRVYDEQGKYSDARRVLEHALVISQEKLGPKNYRIAIVHQYLGILSLDEKKFSDSERHLNEALAIDEKILGAEHPSTAADHNWLGFLNFSQGCYAAAESEYLLGYGALLKNYGPTNPEVGKTASNIAETLRRQGRYAEAAQYDSVAAKAHRQSGGELPASKPDSP